MGLGGADAGFLSAVLFAVVAVLYAQALQPQRSSLLSAARTPQARRSPGMSPPTVRITSALSSRPPGARFREAALVPYFPLYSAVFNYARSHRAMRALGLRATRDRVAAHFAPRHIDQIHNLLIDARRFMLRCLG